MGDHTIQYTVGDGILRGQAYFPTLPSGTEHDHRIGVVVETDIRRAHVVDHEQVDPFALELATGARGSERERAWRTVESGSFEMNSKRVDPNRDDSIERKG